MTSFSQQNEKINLLVATKMLKLMTKSNMFSKI